MTNHLFHQSLHEGVSNLHYFFCCQVTTLVCILLHVHFVTVLLSILYITYMHTSRFWRDLFIGCISIFYHLFYYLEDELLLDSTSPIDLFCLHVVYQPYINHCIGVFVNAWNNHSLTTEGNNSPSQV